MKSLSKVVRKKQQPDWADNMALLFVEILKAVPEARTPGFAVFAVAFSLGVGLSKN